MDIGTHVKMPIGGLTTLVSAIQARSAEMRRLIRAMQIAKRDLLQSREKSVDVMIDAKALSKMSEFVNFLNSGVLALRVRFLFSELTIAR